MVELRERASWPSTVEASIQPPMGAYRKTDIRIAPGAAPKPGPITDTGSSRAFAGAVDRRRTDTRSRCRPSLLQPVGRTSTSWSR